MWGGHQAKREVRGSALCLRVGKGSRENVGGTTGREKWLEPLQESEMRVSQHSVWYEWKGLQETNRMR